MNINKNELAFSLVEIIISISIIVLLAIVGISGKKGYEDNMNNTKIVSDTETINNALESYSQENSVLPIPSGNTNFYDEYTTYAHSSDDAFGVYGSLTEETISKKYLNTLPLDPRTNSYYAYGKTINTNKFEIGSIQIIESIPVAKIVGNYKALDGPYNLIREYNGPNFVHNKSTTNLPYNPDELILIATDKDGNIYREGDEIITGAGIQKEIFFSDGSVSILEPNSKLILNKLNFKDKNNLTTIVKLGLEAGKIWTRATKLNDESEFEVYTTDSSAAVRGTIFSVSKPTASDDTVTTVIKGVVEIKEVGITISVVEPVIQTISVEIGESVKKISTSNNINTTEIEEINTEIEPEFSENLEIRSDETITNNEEQNYSCNIFNEEWKVCMDTIRNLKGWRLSAYAPYNSLDIQTSDMYDGFKKSFNMFGNGSVIYRLEQVMYCNGHCWEPKYINGLFTTPFGGCDEDCNLLSNGFKFGQYNHIIEDKNNNIQGIYIDNHGNDSYLKYDLGIDTNEDFAIEMNIRFPDTIPSRNRTLFNIDKFRLQLREGGEIKLFAPSGSTMIANSREIYDGKFHKVLVKKELNIITVFIDKLKIIILSDDSIITSNILYIGSKSDKTEQLSDIIDYVKIYTKNQIDILPEVEGGNLEPGDTEYGGNIEPGDSEYGGNLQPGDSEYGGNLETGDSEYGGDLETGDSEYGGDSGSRFDNLVDFIGNVQSTFNDFIGNIEIIK